MKNNDNLGYDKQRFPQENNFLSVEHLNATEIETALDGQIAKYKSVTGRGLFLIYFFYSVCVFAALNNNYKVKVISNSSCH